MIRSAVTAARLVVGALLLPACLEAASAERAAEYAKLVDEYRVGNGDRAIRQLLTWNPELMAEAMRDAALPRRGRPLIEPGSFPAAIMLHTEAGLRLNYQEKGFEAAFQWIAAERIARAHDSLERPAFLRAWYYALGQYFLGSDRLGDAVALLEQGRTQFPDDPSIALALGGAYEVFGTFSQGAMRSAWVHRSADEKQELTKAEAIYRSVLAVDAESTQARLHLGRVLQSSRQPEAALVELRRVATTAAPARQRYLAHLFIGDQLLRAGGEAERAESRQEFERALEAWPAGQAAALSLAQILHSSGRRDEAAQVLEGAITPSAKDGEDPFRTYHFGDRTEERPLLERVKAMAQDHQ